MARAPHLPAALLVVGLNHRTAPLSLRDRIFVEDAEVPALIECLRAEGVAEAAVMSTCDRVEVHAMAEDHARAAQAILAALSRRAGPDADAVAAHAYTLHGRAALAQICAVAASLDSQIVGEPQVLGQMRAAHGVARKAGGVGPGLEVAYDTAYAAAKRVRAETAIAEGPASMAAVAVRLAHDLHGDLDRCGALLIGDGELGALVAMRLKGAGLARLTVAAPRSMRAEAAAQELGGHAAPFEALDDALDDADVVLCTVGGRRHVLAAAALEAALRRRRRRPVLVFDLAVPGDAEPAIEAVEEAFLYTLDDLERLAAQGRARREEAAAAARRIVEEACDGLAAERGARQAGPSVTALRSRFTEIRDAVLAEAGSADAAEVARRLVNRLLHDPSEGLRAIARDEGDAAREEAERLLRRLFALDNPPSGDDVPDSRDTAGSDTEGDEGP